MSEKTKKGERTKSSPSELEARYRKNVAHSVNRVIEWLDKLEALATSRKHKLTELDKEKILSAVNMKYLDFTERMMATTSEAQKPSGFKLE